MGLEAATFINQLVATNPVGATDPRSQGDDHLRLIKLALQNTFPAITGAVTATHGELNQLHGGLLASIGNGAVGGPAFSFASDPDCGLFHVAANHIAMSVGGVKVQGWGVGANSPNVIYGGSGAGNTALTVNNAADTLNLFIVRGDGQSQFVDGGVGAPAVSFLLDPDTGLYRAGANDIVFTVGGVPAAQFLLSGGIGQTSVADGTIAIPGLAFNNDLDTGLYRAGANAFVAVSGGVAVATFNSGANATLQLADGSAGLPALGFTNDANTGIFRNVSGLNLVWDGSIFLQGTDTSIVIGVNAGFSLGFLCLTTAGASTGASGAPPAQVAGYIAAVINGTTRKIPYYAN